MAKQKTNSRGLSLLKEEEGLRLNRYIDAVGVPTIGYGHAIKKGERLTKITERQADELLEADLLDAEAAVERLAHVPLNSNQFSALVSFVFNLGEDKVADSTMFRLLNAGDYQGAAKQFSRWNKGKQGGRLVALPGLTRRRAREAALFSSPVAARRTAQGLEAAAIAPGFAQEGPDELAGGAEGGISGTALIEASSPSALATVAANAPNAAIAASQVGAGLLPGNLGGLLDFAKRNKDGITQATRGTLGRRVVLWVTNAYLGAKAWTVDNPVLTGLLVVGIVALVAYFLFLSNGADWHRRELEADKTKKDGIR